MQQQFLCIYTSTMLYSTHNKLCMSDVIMAQYKSLSFTDINECLVAALDIFAPDLCGPSMFCVNVEGNYSCECPAGTLLVEGVCEAGKPILIDYIRMIGVSYRIQLNF